MKPIYYPSDYEWWTDISREEREYCQALYEAIRSDNNLAYFIREMNKLEPEKGERHGEIGEVVDVGYEVCFYRDLLFSHKKCINAVKDTLKSRGNDPLPVKRTFDLCLFGETTIYVIEAKAAVGLEKEQIDDFAAEQKRINILMKEIGRESNIVSVKFIVIASKDYYGSPSFKLEKGAGRYLLEKLKNDLIGCFSWDQLAMIFKSQKSLSDKFQQADACYKKACK